jgi:hypothetical protein
MNSPSKCIALQVIVTLSVQEVRLFAREPCESQIHVGTFGLSRSLRFRLQHSLYIAAEHIPAKHEHNLVYYVTSDIADCNKWKHTREHITSQTGVLIAEDIRRYHFFGLLRADLV